jgi:hypothetical protein
MDLERLFEILDRPVKYQTVNNGIITFTVDSIGYTVSIDEAIIRNYNCKSITFVSDNTETISPLNNSAPHAKFVLATIVDIVKKEIKPCDILFVQSDDSNLDIAGRKMKIYEVIAARLKTSGLLAKIGILQIKNMNKPTLYGILPGSKALSLDEKHIQSLAIEFGVNKMQRQHRGN